jgi:hypothetical protein
MASVLFILGKDIQAIGAAVAGIVPVINIIRLVKQPTGLLKKSVDRRVNL